MDKSQNRSDRALSVLVSLFNKSPIKQIKWQALQQALELTHKVVDNSESAAVDYGADNGVISYLLRKHYPLYAWHSADLTAQTVESIRSLGLDRVTQISADELPYSNNQFGVSLVVDLLEHIADDQSLINEIIRTTEPGGLIILNVPHLVPGFLRNLTLRLGFSDKLHGHLRPGYKLNQLDLLMAGSGAKLLASREYQQFFSAAVDLLIRFLVEKNTGHPIEPAMGENKGVILTETELVKLRKKLKLFGIAYPFLMLLTKLDLILKLIPPFLLPTQLKAGRMLIATYQKREEPGQKSGTNA